MDRLHGAERLEFRELPFTKVGVKDQRIREQLLRLDDIPYADLQSLDAALADLDCVVTLQAEVPGAKRRRAHELRVVGTLWGIAQGNHQSILRITRIATDPAWRGAAEWKLMDILKEDMIENQWSRLIVCAPSGKEHHPMAQFAGRHPFRFRDVRMGKKIWEWSLSDIIQPSEEV